MSDSSNIGLWVLPTELGDDVDDMMRLEAARSASYLLWSLSGRKFSGIRQVTERYTAKPLGRDAQQTLVSVDPQGLSAVIGEVEERSRLVLRSRPVRQIDQVRTLGGTVIADTDYYLTDHSAIQFLVPMPDNLEVDYTYGFPPPVAGKLAARKLAHEFLLSWTDSEDCALPQRVTSVSRQGLTFAILDNQDFIADLRTGVYAVDLFLKSVNPDNARRKAKVFSPDAPRGRRGIPKPQPVQTQPDNGSGVAGGWIIVPTDQTGI